MDRKRARGRDYQRRYYAANKDKWSKWNAEYAARYPEKIAEKQRRRAAIFKSAEGERLREAIRAVDPDCRTVIDLFCGGGCGSVGLHGRAWEYIRDEREVAVA